MGFKCFKTVSPKIISKIETRKNLAPLPKILIKVKVTGFMFKIPLAQAKMLYGTGVKAAMATAIVPYFS